MSLEKPELWAHQKVALKRFRGYPAAALFWDPGTGKSAAAIHLLRNAMNEEMRFFKTLIFTPQIVVQNWANEIAKHSKIDSDRVCLLGTGTAKKREASFQEWHKKYDGKFIAILNYEALLMPKLYAALKAWGCDAIIGDELHRCKSHDAKRSKLLYDLANPWDEKLKQPARKPLFIGLTGTPILNDPEDLFMQYKILDGGKTFGLNYFVFRSTYFTNRNSQAPSHVTWPKWEIKTLAKDGVDALATIKHKIEPTSMYVKKEDCLDLPPLIQKTIHIEMGDEQKKHYEEMKRDFVTYLNDSACVSTLAITKALRLTQIVSGYLPITLSNDSGMLASSEVHLFNANPRLEALADLLTDLTPGHKVIVWAVWKANYKQIGTLLDKMKIKYVTVHGETSKKDKDKAVDLFQNDPDTRVFLGNPGAGGIGISLTSASYSIFYSRTTSLEHSLQAEARNYRHGSEQHSKITRIDLVAAGTIDEVIFNSLANKEEVSLKILQKNIASL